MAISNKSQYASRFAARGEGVTAADIARFGAGDSDGAPLKRGHSRLDIVKTDKLMAEERSALRRKVLVSMAILAVLTFCSLGITGAAGENYLESAPYAVYTPIEVGHVLAEHAYNGVADLTHLYAAHTTNYITENVPGYYAVPKRAGVVGITLLCAVLLGVSGALYQAVFKNPIAGPGMLGVGSGVSLGMMLLVYIFGMEASGEIGMRYAMCYGFGAAILVFVILAGKRLSGKGRPFDIVTMLLIGSILSQLLGFVVSYVTLFVMDPSDYELYYSLSQMLTVDVSALSWICLAIAFAVSMLPVFIMRFKLNALAFEEEEVRLMGLDITKLRAVALICGAIMILAAQIHTGAVAMVSLIVPFMARSWFGCEFRKQLVGCVCIGTIVLLACRDLCDLIPFVGDGLAIGSVVAVAAMPLFLLIMSRHMRGWE